MKHTPLYPHHPLIAARLLREPTLLAQLPPHPCLIGVQGYIKTPDHVYLVEQLSRSHTPLSALEVPISVGLAGKILDQLVSVVRDGLHVGGRVCHRDLKADNLLIDEYVIRGTLWLKADGIADRKRFSFVNPEPGIFSCWVCLFYSLKAISTRVLICNYVP